MDCRLPLLLPIGVQPLKVNIKNSRADVPEKIFFIYITPYRHSVKKGGLYLFPILFLQKLCTYTFGMGTKNIVISIIKLQEYIKGCALAFFAESTGASFGKRFTLQCVCRPAAQAVPDFYFYNIISHFFDSLKTACGQPSTATVLQVSKKCGGYYKPQNLS